MRKANLLILVLALVMGGLAAMMARSWVNNQAGAVPAPVSNTIVVAKVKMGFGTELTRDNVTEIHWAAATVPEGAFRTKEELFKKDGKKDGDDVRRVALTPIDRNEPVLAGKVTGPDQRGTLSALVAPGYKAVTVRVDDVRGVAGFVLPGDRVDVVLIRTHNLEGGKKDHSSDVLLQNAKVLAVDQLANERQEKATVAKAVTLEVTTEDAQKILLASDVGRLSLILRHAGQAEAETATRITESDLTVTRQPARVPAPPSLARTPQMATVDIVRGTKRESYSVKKWGDLQ
jgi:pilus assembly protein CpaB